jgi:hypothetical protein
MISYTDLVPGKEYYIKTHDSHGYHKEMIFIEHETAFNDMAPENNVVSIMIFRKKSIHTMIMTYYSFYEEDYYYDTERIKQIRDNAQQAREQMEERSLNTILKKLVNEHFEW